MVTTPGRVLVDALHRKARATARRRVAAAMGR
jgi:hypothetical protein